MKNPIMTYIPRFIEQNISATLNRGKSVLLLGPRQTGKTTLITHQIIIEVKWTEKPNHTDAKHLIKFMDEYPEAKQAFVICRTPHRYKITEQVMALPWQELNTLFNYL